MTKRTYAGKLASIEDVKRKNKIRDRFKKQRLWSVTLAQRMLYEAMQTMGKGRFIVAKEREIYTKHGVRFADIYIRKYGLAIEVDGGYHREEEQKVEDKIRETQIWDKKRILTIRVSNSDITMENGDSHHLTIPLVDQYDPVPSEELANIRRSVLEVYHTEGIRGEMPW